MTDLPPPPRPAIQTTGLTATPTLTVEFDRTFDLGGLVVHGGSGTEAEFLTHRRPKTIELTFPGSDQAAIEIELTDTADAQLLTVDARDVDTIVIRVVDTFDTGPNVDGLLAIREFEFKERR